MSTEPDVTTPQGPQEGETAHQPPPSSDEPPAGNDASSLTTPHDQTISRAALGECYSDEIVFCTIVERRDRLDKAPSHFLWSKAPRFLFLLNRRHIVLASPTGQKIMEVLYSQLSGQVGVARGEVTLPSSGESASQAPPPSASVVTGIILHFFEPLPPNAPRTLILHLLIPELLDAKHHGKRITIGRELWNGDNNKIIAIGEKLLMLLKALHRDVTEVSVEATMARPSEPGGAHAESEPHTAGDDTAEAGAPPAAAAPVSAEEPSAQQLHERLEAAESRALSMAEQLSTERRERQQLLDQELAKEREAYAQAIREQEGRIEQLEKQLQAGKKAEE